MQESQHFQGIVESALEMIRDGQVVGLGSGRAATAFVEGLGARVGSGLCVQGVPTSEATAALAQKLGIPLVTLDSIDQIDIDIDADSRVDSATDEEG